MPGFWLKRQILMNLPSEDLEVSVANSIDFMVERVSEMDTVLHPFLRRKTLSLSIYVHYA